MAITYAERSSRAHATERLRCGFKTLVGPVAYFFIVYLNHTLIQYGIGLVLRLHVAARGGGSIR